MAERAVADRTGGLYEQLRDQLLVGRFPPGERLSPVELADLFGVSRTPIREALARLEHDGLLTRVGSRFEVPVRSVDEILDLYDARVTIAGLIAGSAAQRRTEANVVLLQRANAQARSLEDPARRPVDAVASNRAFHMAVTDAAHNVVLADLQQRLDFRVANLPATTLTHQGRWVDALRQHEELADAIANRDAELATSIAVAHLRAARTIWLERIRGPVSRARAV